MGKRENWMSKVKVPLSGSLFELASGRQLVPGEVVELSKDESSDNKALIEEALADGRLLDASKIEEGGEK
jgi:hypothetical protein